MRSQAPAKADRRALAGVEDVSAYLGIPVPTLHQWRHKGIGPKAVRVGRWLRYDWKDVDAYIEGLHREQAGGRVS